MNRTWKENYTEKMKNKVRKNEKLKYPIKIWLILVTIFYNVGYYFVNNSKRFACILSVVVFFFTGSSFSFVGEADYDNGLSEDKWAEIQEMYEYVPTVLKTETDSLKTTEDEEYGDGESIVQYSLDDILDESEDDEVNVIDAVDYTTERSKLSKDDWQLILVNKQHPIPEDYEFTAGVIKGSMKCDVRILTELKAMMKAAKADGVNLVVCSPYRDFDRQTVLFNRKIDYYTEKGYSYLEAYKLASITVTVPGASEHQIGLALDIVSTTYSSLEIGFGDTKAGKWLAANCADYGFIVRYPLGKEDITGIQYEPWHFRYVGKTAATEIMERGITLEEFVAELD
jgi:D-alanyl-D-alanine carboxypeptidase